jgi:translation elongation factor EF-Ts
MMLGPTVMLMVLAGQAEAATARVKETAVARVAKAQSVGRDALVHQAVVASNSAVETPDEIRRRDTMWIANRRDPRRQAIVTAPCSDRVRELVKEDSLIVEAFVMNNRGTLVCSIAETSDYWQGDEPKWLRTFVEGKEAFVEEPAFDVSTGKYAIQVSVPVLDGPKRIGAVTLTLKLNRQDAAAGSKR